jgi:hypothetical protein
MQPAKFFFLFTMGWEEDAVKKYQGKKATSTQRALSQIATDQ